MKTFRLPDLGEGPREAEIVKWLVAPGDQVAADQSLVSVETDKAVVELPSPYAGRIVTLFGKPGDIVPTGAPLVEIEEAEGGRATSAAPERAEEDRRAGGPQTLEGEGEGTGEEAATHERAETALPSEPSAPPSGGSIDAGTVVGRIERTREAALAGRPSASAAREARALSEGREPSEPSQRPRAVPAVRMLARRLGVDLQAIVGSGPSGAITRSDVERAVSGSMSGAGESAGATSAQAVVAEGYEPLRGPRRAMARNMSRAHDEVASATVSDDASLRSWASGVDTMVRLIRAVGAACKASPQLNAWYDGAARARKLHDHLDLGIAVDTEDGLFVPVLRNADSRTDEELREELNALRAAVAARTISRDLLGGQFLTLSNFGTIGGRYASLVVVPPQVAIVGAGHIEQRAVARDGALWAESVLPLSVTFDHRAVSGAEAARFLAALIEDLESAT
jgi:pyruvate dehydrogenase E2 component (dihydrolipoamide acetyltransferase)